MHYRPPPPPSPLALQLGERGKRRGIGIGEGYFGQGLWYREVKITTYQSLEETCQAGNTLWNACDI